MKITANSVTSEELTEKFREPMLVLEERLQKILGGNDYGGGIRSLAFLAVSVFEDDAENESFVGNFSKTGYFKYPASGERVKYLSIAFAISPVEAAHESALGLASLFLARLLAALKDSRFPSLKGFNVEKLIADVEIEMSNMKARESIQ